MTESKLTAEQILEGHPPPIVELCNTLRDLIKKSLPGVTEKAYPGWHAIGYRHSEAGYLCGIFPFEDYVKLYFEHGKFLFDPENILTGDGSQTRYIYIGEFDEVPANAITNLLMESVDFRLNRLGADG